MKNVKLKFNLLTFYISMHFNLIVSDISLDVFHLERKSLIDEVIFRNFMSSLNATLLMYCHALISVDLHKYRYLWEQTLNL